MPAPSPYTPPQPSKPPNHPSPRISRAHRLSSRSNSSVSSTHLSSVSSDRDRQTSAHSVRRQLLPSTSTLPSQSPSPAPVEEAQGDPDEDLKDPEHFIRAFSQVNGPLTKLNHQFVKKLERYLVKVNLSPDHALFMPGTSKNTGAPALTHVNFAEAALVVQGSTRIYGKKVDLLFDAAINLFRLLSTPFEELENEDEEDEQVNSAAPRTPRANKRPRLTLENQDLAEDVHAVDCFKEGKKIEQKKVTCRRFAQFVKELSRQPRGNIRYLPPNIPRLVRKAKALGTNAEEMERLSSRRVPQLGQGLESRGFIDEYRLNELVRRPDAMLVDHVIPVVKETVLSMAATPNKSYPANDSGIDSCPSSVYNPVENAGAHDWEGNSVSAACEADNVSLLDDGFQSEGPHEDTINEMDEENEQVFNDNGLSVMEKSDETIEAEAVISEHDNGENTEVEAVCMEQSGTETSGHNSEGAPTDQESHATEDEREPVREAETRFKDPTNTRPSPEVGTIPLKEMEITPTPRRNKRKLKSFKLPCKLSLLLPEKKKRLTRNNRAAALWRPSQSPCSSSSSNYPQSPISYTAASPDHHSLALLLQDDEPHIPFDTLSDSENEGDYFDPPPDGQPQVNHWIRNHEKDLLSAGQETTLSDRVAQWQELIMPRLDTSLEHGPYSHVRYAPILVELVARAGWPPPVSLATMSASLCNDADDLCDSEDEMNFHLDWKKQPTKVTDKAPLTESRCVTFIPYDSDFVESRECDEEWGGEHFLGFRSVKQIKRRGVVLLPDSVASQGNDKSLFSVLSETYDWGLKDQERQLLKDHNAMDKWLSDKAQWLQNRVRASGPRRRNWDDWVEENDNIEINNDLDVTSLRRGCSSVGRSEPVHFTTVFSGFRKEEVSRLLFTALHLASQGHMEITSLPGEINSMTCTLLTSTGR